MAEFEVIMPLLGGMLVGISAAMMLLFSGRIAGISGIFGGMVFQQGSERAWRSAFVLGLIGGGVGLHNLSPELFANTSGRSLDIIALAGILVGIGTRICGGCTSGHGVCGLALLSPRSLTAMATFMLAAGLTVYVVRHVVAG